jgi:uncharacterized protein YegL
VTDAAGDGVQDGGLPRREVKFPIWFEPQNRGNTSMCAALLMAIGTLNAWCKLHHASFPPLVLHVSDGHPTDGDPEPIANVLKSSGTNPSVQSSRRYS